MLEQLRKLIQVSPFRAFRLELSGGRQVRVPHRDHIMVTTKGIIVVEDDDGLVDIIPALHLAAINCEGTISPA